MITITPGARNPLTRNQHAILSVRIAAQLKSSRKNRKKTS